MMSKIENAKEEAKWISDKSTLDSGFFKFKSKPDGTYPYMVYEDMEIGRLDPKNADRWIREHNEKVIKESLSDNLSSSHNSTIITNNLHSESINEKIVLMTKFTPVPYAKKLMNEGKFLYDKYKRFWRYDSKNGIWIEDAKDYIKNRLRLILMGEEQQKNQYTEEVVSYIRDYHYNPDFDGSLNPNIIPFDNCLYNLETGQIEEFKSEYFVTNKIPVKLDSDYKECPIIDKFFEDCIGKKYKDILYDLGGYCLYRGVPYQKLFFLFGPGKTGKSTYNELLMNFLGIDNVSTVSPHDICGGNRFALGSMWNKYANISSDISYEVLKNVNKIKELTGGDTVYVERKYQEGFPCKLYAKQIYSTNQLPIVNDKTDAWYRRPYLIEFSNKVKKIDSLILNKLTKPEELSGFAWKCLQHLVDMKNNDFKFTYDIDEEKMTTFYEDLSNPLNKFIREKCVEDGLGHIFKYEFRDQFQEWLKLSKFRVWTEREIGIQMTGLYESGRRDTNIKELGYNNSYGTFENKRYMAYLGLRWKKKEDFVKDNKDVNDFITSFLYIERDYKMVDMGVMVDTTFIPTESIEFVKSDETTIILEKDKLYRSDILTKQEINILLQSNKIKILNSV